MIRDNIAARFEIPSDIISRLPSPPRRKPPCLESFIECGIERQWIQMGWRDIMVRRILGVFTVPPYNYR